MASDSIFFLYAARAMLGNNEAFESRVPFNTLKTSADASGNGVEVVAAAATGKSHYLTGFVFYNGSVGALSIMAVHTAGAAGKTQIAANISVAAATSVVVNFDVPLQVGTAKNLGIVASGAGAIEVHMFGYTV